MGDINDPLKTAGRGDCEIVLEAIEALKRWIYGPRYAGPEKEPVPTTEDEFSLLMDGLRRWATLHAPHTDTGRLQDYRRAELRRRSEGGVPDQLAEREWRVAAAKADDALNELKILLTEAQGKKAKKMTREEANARAMELAKRLGQKFFLLSGREQARQIGCSWKTWERTALYQTVKAKAKRLQMRPSSRRSAVSFTPGLESVTGEGEKDEVLNNLIAEQRADDEPRPLDDSGPKKVRCRKRL